VLANWTEKTKVVRENQIVRSVRVMLRQPQKLWTNGFDDSRFHPFDAGISFFHFLLCPPKGQGK